MQIYSIILAGIFKFKNTKMRAVDIDIQVKFTVPPI